MENLTLKKLGMQSLGILGSKCLKCGNKFLIGNWKTKYCRVCLEKNPELDIEGYKLYVKAGWIKNPDLHPENSCCGCAYYEEREDLVFTDSFLAQNDTRIRYRCLKLNIALKESVYNCPHRKTTQQVINETPT